MIGHAFYVQKKNYLQINIIITIKSVRGPVLLTIRNAGGKKTEPGRPVCGNLPDAVSLLAGAQVGYNNNSICTQFKIR